MYILIIDNNNKLSVLCIFFIVLTHFVFTMGKGHKLNQSLKYEYFRHNL